MGFRLLFLFVVVPLIELTLLVRLGEIIGLGNTILIVVLTGIAGTALAKHQGTGVWRRFNSRVSQGQMPGAEIADGLIILVCGALLMTPGVLTDVVGLLGLIPASRGVLRKQLSAYAKRHAMASSTPFSNMSFGTPPMGEPMAAPPRPEAENRAQSGRDITNDVEAYRRRSDM